MNINQENVSEILEKNSTINTFSKPQLCSKILHFGVGGFHRAHQAVYTAEAMDHSKDYSWGITGVGILASDKTMADILKAQDYNYSLMIKPYKEKSSLSIVNTISNYIHAYNNYEDLRKASKNNDLAIISMTVTEGGYNIDPNTGKFDWNNDNIKFDIENFNTPKTIFGFLALCLRERKLNNQAGVTLLSCDNVQHNGRVLEYTLLEFLSKQDQNLKNWVKEKCSFPNSMVDRITPKTADEDKKTISQDFGIEDQWPVVCEPFTQWVVEDKFVTGRPRWEDVGAQFVKDVSPYEKMKLRLLNSSHQALAYIGYLHGYRYVHESAQDETIQKFLLNYMKNEVEVTLDSVPGIDLDEYQKSVIDRFANPNIADTLQRICEFTSDRIPVFNLPIIHEQLNQSKTLKLSALIVASWRVYLEGFDERGEKIDVVDNKKDFLLDFIAKNDNPLDFIKIKEIFHDIASDEKFVGDYLKAFEAIKQEGALGAIAKIL
ncbi:mannitol dehydrogenase family protein [Francisella adeliensis]|uniref:Mannitol dehydrogenase family protein n=1 Tax=Francisella adeliensis TaxID=2007306 RepID=A0A2Z4XXF3_9GAMM|nr:mannitol dehydrogenase family protein [Francisella adeliensis]AXA33103.1 hypothetical protein CDH04_01130 [Francisella adeliensis]MBK2086005.1 mannitol dehydrogenase family protein [Francisella adeliensis]MBK2096831.1 mannitol dehydrogenase family protein [Francisella adeliensis]QIW11333.1 mannitol dehydrogenase family protein [Francisella adeliensis]QIW13207.1 mannitol dehydrogenase family protein [Francisella adeliensis]